MSNLVELQKELSELPLLKDASNPFFKSNFLSLKALTDAVIPVLNKHGYAMLQPLTHINGDPAIATILIKVDDKGEEEIVLREVSPLILGKVDPQEWGKSITYARRYGMLSSICGVADEDDDAETAVGRGTNAQSSTQPRNKRTI